MRTVIIIQARMGSTRLPGKVMKPILGEPMLARQLERVHRIKGVEQIVVATTEKDADQAIVELINRIPSVGLYRGSEEDVLDRYYQAAKTYKADIIVRVTADCPFIDPKISSKVLLNS